MSKNCDLTKAKKLLLKKLTGTITAPEDETLQAWMAESESNRKLAERVFSEDFLSKAILDRNKEKQQLAWTKLADRLGVRRAPRLTPRFRKAAAAIVLGLLCGSSYYYYKYVDEPVIEAGSPQAVFYISGQPFPLEGNTVHFDRFLRENAPAQTGEKEISPDLYAHINVPRGGEYKIVLEDSTYIHLNSGSSLYVAADFSPENRNISLSGEAYLEVHHDEQHPFTIRTEKADVRVLGTTLNIEAYEDEPVTTVTLLKGRVEVFSGKERAEIPAGHSAEVNEERHIHIARADVGEQTAWHHNRIVFNDRPDRKSVV